MMTQEVINQIWSAGRDNNEPFAMTIMGIWLYEGKIIKQDLQSAYGILQNMASANVLWAKDLFFYISAIQIPDPDLNRHVIISSDAMQQLENYAVQGSVYAMVALGQMLYEGISVPQDKQTGLEYLRRSAQMGCLFAQHLLQDFLNNERMPTSDYSSIFHQNREETVEHIECISEASDCMAELNGLIGLSDVKKEIQSLRNFVMIQTRRKHLGMQAMKVSYHCVFSGSPGTGKTTVARIVAGIYKDLGILKKGHLVEVQRSDLVAEYVGQTAVKTNKKIDEALDGILFIDEAYTLSSGGTGDFGQEAINTLLKRMEDERDRLVIILAGYDHEIRQFINSNPGLESRFNRYIHFADYSSTELFRIFTSNLQKFQYSITPEANTAVNSLIEDAVMNKNDHFGNARFIRNIFERIIQNQANRLSCIHNPTPVQLATIELSDIKINN